MKTKNIKITFLFSAIFLSLLISFLFPFKPSFANASNGTLEIVGPDIIDTVKNPIDIEFTAVLTNSNFNSDSIRWYYNQTLIDPSYYPQGTDTKISTLRLVSSNYLGASSGSLSIITAKVLNKGVEIYATIKEVVIIKTTNPITLQVEGDYFQNFKLTGAYNPFLFRITSPTITSQNVTWYLKELNNKYVPLPNQSVKENYQLNVTEPGTYTVLVKVDQVFSNPISVKIHYEEISSLVLEQEEIGKNNLGFTIYKFTLQNLTSNQDVSNIAWYRTGYNSPLQYGGDTFIFEPSSYSTYKIYAKYEPTQIESNSHFIENKIDRTKDILIFASVIVGVMTVGLVLLIYRNIKKDKIW